MGASRKENRTPYIDRGEPLPTSYAENRIVAMVREPEMVFVYWDVATDVRVAGAPLVLRVRCLSEGTSYDIEPSPPTDEIYLRVTPNRRYRVDLFARGSAGELRKLASSQEVATPVRWPGQSGEETPDEILHARRWPVARRAARPRPLAARPPAKPAASPPQPVPATEVRRPCGPHYRAYTSA